MRAASLFPANSHNMRQQPCSLSKCLRERQRARTVCARSLQVTRLNVYNVKMWIRINCSTVAVVIIIAEKSCYIYIYTVSAYHYIQVSCIISLASVKNLATLRAYLLWSLSVLTLCWLKNSVAVSLTLISNVYLKMNFKKRHTAVMESGPAVRLQSCFLTLGHSALSLSSPSVH